MASADAQSPTRSGKQREPLWRELLGHRLRLIRLEQGLRLVDVAHRAGIAPQYLSEIERGQKDPSSEIIAAIAGALDVHLVDLTATIAGAAGRRDANWPRVVDLSGSHGFASYGSRGIVSIGQAASGVQLQLELAA